MGDYGKSLDLGRSTAPRRIKKTIFICDIIVIITAFWKLDEGVTNNVVEMLPKEQQGRVSSGSYANISDIYDACNILTRQPNATKITVAHQRNFIASDEYPEIYRSCFLIPTNNSTRDSHLLSLYPNSFLVTSSTDSVTRIDHGERTITINGTDTYDLLWKKTMEMWDLVASLLEHDFSECNWFFKVDTDSVINLHFLEQVLDKYDSSDNHYLGYFPGLTGRSAHGKPVQISIGAFYGISRKIMLQWRKWRSDGRHEWGTYHPGEDSQTAFFLREHGVCMDIPFLDPYQFRIRNMWGGFESRMTKADCLRKVEKLIDPCFSFAHKVPLDWVDPLNGAVASYHVAKRSKCPLIDNWGSRVVNMGVFHRVATENCTKQCDPCLMDGRSCCEWAKRETKKGGTS